MEFSLYRQVMGADFEQLDLEVKAVHTTLGSKSFPGYCTIMPPNSLMSKALCRLMRLPTQAFSGAFTFELHASARKEVWIRHFPGSIMRSEMCVVSGKLVERIGYVRFFFSLIRDKQTLRMVLESASLCGITLPKKLLPEIWGVETGSDGKFHFDAGATWGFLGRLASYSGWVETK